MAEISAQMVRELRERTGVAMMDCKNALAEAGGNMESAIDLLRKKGLAKQAKLASREATEGRIAVAVSPDARSGVIVEINTNTDFTAKSEPLAALAELATAKLLADASAAQLTRYPEGLASALRKIAADPEPLEAANRATQHLYIVNPMMGGLAGLFRTHPATAERIARLRTMASQTPLAV